MDVIKYVWMALFQMHKWMQEENWNICLDGVVEVIILRVVVLIVLRADWTASLLFGA